MLLICKYHIQLLLSLFILIYALYFRLSLYRFKFYFLQVIRVIQALPHVPQVKKCKSEMYDAE